MFFLGHSSGYGECSGDWVVPWYDDEDLFDGYGCAIPPVGFGLLSATLVAGVGFEFSHFNIPLSHLQVHIRHLDALATLTLLSKSRCTSTWLSKVESCCPPASDTANPQIHGTDGA